MIDLPLPFGGVWAIPLDVLAALVCAAAACMSLCVLGFVNKTKERFEQRRSGQHRP